jgi:hypothetical protein
MENCYLHEVICIHMTFRGYVYPRERDSTQTVHAFDMPSFNR